MSTLYGDTSAVIAAIEDSAIRGRFQSGKHITRSHTLGEMFSTLTGGRYQPQYSPKDAADLVDAIAAFRALSAASPSRNPGTRSPR